MGLTKVTNGKQIFDSNAIYNNRDYISQYGKLPQINNVNSSNSPTIGDKVSYVLKHTGGAIDTTTTVTEDFILTAIQIVLAVQGVASGQSVYINSNKLTSWEFTNTSGTANLSNNIPMPNLKIFKNDVLKISRDVAGSLTATVTFIGYKA